MCVRLFVCLFVCVYTVCVCLRAYLRNCTARSLFVGFLLRVTGCRGSVVFWHATLRYVTYFRFLADGVAFAHRKVVTRRAVTQSDSPVGSTVLTPCRVFKLALCLPAVYFYCNINSGSQSVTPSVHFVELS